MKEALVSKGPSVEIIGNPIPTPGPDQVLIRVIVSGTNPKDWYVPAIVMLAECL
jgi:NADPH:quinone reductase-like Zn-dependent oxidoreductase